MSDLPFVWCLWVGVAWALYPYLGYPSLLRLFAALQPRPSGTGIAAGSDDLRVSVIVCAHNEQDAIGARIRNILDQADPLAELIVASDGSTDDTVARALAAADRRTRVLDFTAQRGKALTHNDCVASATGDVLVFTDARTRFRPGALLALCRPFCHPLVGVTVGELSWRSPDGRDTAVPTNAYWRLEAQIRADESSLGILATGSGPIMAIRRTCFRQLQADEDADSASPLDALGQGLRVVHVPDALAVDESPGGAQGEFRDRSRMVSTDLRGTLRRLPPIRPWRRPGVWWGVLSHKVSRWLSPFAVIPFMVGAVGSSGHPSTRVFIAIAVVAVALVVTGGAVEAASGRRLPLAALAFTFTVACAGMASGVLRTLAGRRTTMWDRPT